MAYLRRFLSCIMMSVVAYAGWSGYVYLLDTTKPAIELVGLEPHAHYAGDISCVLRSSKAGDVSVYLDGKQLTDQFSISACQQGYVFALPTQTLAEGTHTLRVQVCDRTYHHNTTELERAFYVENTPLIARFVSDESVSACDVLQGRTMHVQFQLNKDVQDAKLCVMGQEYPCFPESKSSHVYETFVPVSCEQKPSEHPFHIEVTDRVGTQFSLDGTLRVLPYEFKQQKITVSNDKVQEEEALGANERMLEQEVERITLASPRKKLWSGEFCTPIDVQRVTCEFGTIRTTQHKGRYAHKALDVINFPKSVVWASHDGIVALKDRFAGSGNTVIIDHGWGLLSMFFHLDDFASIEVGQKIAKGNPIGTLGKTGYATGYHLHWEMRLNNVPVDPMQWTEATF